jgi:glycosyltransferase involved in cell wall biosynthesis
MSTMPIIYVVDGSVAITGAFISARSIAEMLSDQVSMEIILPNTSRIPIEELGGFNVLSTIPMVHLSKRLGALLAYIPALIEGSWLLHKRMKRDGVQCLILNDFYFMQGVLLRVLGYRGRIITWVRCEPKRFAGPLAGIMLWLQRLTANRIITVSRFIQQRLPHAQHVTVIPNAYLGKKRTPRLWETKEEKTILYVGNYIIGKGHDVALEAFAQVAAQDETLRLTFVGDDMGLEKNRAFRATLEARAKELGLTDRVTFHAFVADTYPLLERAYMALNCSVSESFSRTVLEASGAGVPVIATASGGPQEILVEGVTGFLEPVGDVSSIARRILQLAQDSALANRMGEAGADHIHQHFSADSITKQLQNALME